VPEPSGLRGIPLAQTSQYFNAPFVPTTVCDSTPGIRPNRLLFVTADDQRVGPNFRVREACVPC
jgi:hypothetical protein